MPYTSILRMWTVVVPNEIEVYVENESSDNVRALAAHSLANKSEDGQHSYVLWTGARVRSQNALDRFLRSLDFLATNRPPENLSAHKFHPYPPFGQQPAHD